MRILPVPAPAGQPADYASARIRQLDLAYHDIDPERVFHALVRRGGQRILPEGAAGGEDSAARHSRSAAFAFH